MDIQSLSSIGVVAQLTGLTERQIRYLEKAHIISPQKTQGGRRLYTVEQIAVLRRIKQLKDRHVGIERIKETLSKDTANLLQNSSAAGQEVSSNLRRYQDAKVFFVTSSRNGKGAQSSEKGR